MWYRVNGNLKLDALFFNFLPSWWHRNYGVEFGQRYVFDPDYRVEVLLFLERTIAQHLPGLPVGSTDPEAHVSAPDFGNAVTPAAAGCAVEYPVDNYPWNHHLPVDQITQLALPEDITSVFPYTEIIRQVAYLNRKLSQDVLPWLPTRGILNDAALLCGVDIMGDLAADSHAMPVLDYTFGILACNAEANYQRFSYQGGIMLTNCTAIMVSPRMYRERLLPYDLYAYDVAARYGYGEQFALHHCGVFDRFAPIYRAIPQLSFIEIGWDSDVRTALDAFPEATIQYIFSASFAAGATPSQVQERVEALLQTAKPDLHRFRISVPDLEYGTPEANLYTIYEACRA